MFETVFFENDHIKIGYRLVENPSCNTDRCALLIHGAGVGGVETFGPMYPFFSEWRWMLMPDLVGMGESHFSHGEEGPVTVELLSRSLQDLLDALMWESFDIVGYSLGGLVALHLNGERQPDGRLILLEPAALDRLSIDELLTVRRRYRDAAQLIRDTGDVEQGIALFMDSVSPNRRKNPQVEETTQSRLAHRPFGFAYALDAVTQWVEVAAKGDNCRQTLIEKVDKALLFSGALSHVGLIEHYDHLCAQYPNWQHHTMAGCDHSLPFQKPRQIAIKVNQWIKN